MANLLEKRLAAGRDALGGREVDQFNDYGTFMDLYRDQDGEQYLISRSKLEDMRHSLGLEGKSLTRQVRMLNADGSTEDVDVSPAIHGDKRVRIKPFVDRIGDGGVLWSNDDEDLYHRNLERDIQLREERLRIYDDAAWDMPGIPTRLGMEVARVGTDVVAKPVVGLAAMVNAAGYVATGREGTAVGRWFGGATDRMLEAYDDLSNFSASMSMSNYTPDELSTVQSVAEGVTDMSTQLLVGGAVGGATRAATSGAVKVGGQVVDAGRVALPQLSRQGMRDYLVNGAKAFFAGPGAAYAAMQGASAFGETAATARANDQSRERAIWLGTVDALTNMSLARLETALGATFKGGDLPGGFMKIFKSPARWDVAKEMLKGMGVEVLSEAADQYSHMSFLEAAGADVSEWDKLVGMGTAVLYAGFASGLAEGAGYMQSRAELKRLRREYAQVRQEVASAVRLDPTVQANMAAGRETVLNDGLVAGVRMIDANGDVRYGDGTVAHVDGTLTTVSGVVVDGDGNIETAGPARSGVTGGEELDLFSLIRGGDMRVYQVLVDRIVVNDRIHQFKADADPDTGEVVPLQGQFQPIPTKPILVMEFNDGHVEVVTGRHRLGLARRNGLTEIPANVIRERDGWTIEMAKTMDAYDNILDNQGSDKDFVDFFRHSKVTDGEIAHHRELIARPRQRMAYDVARGASEDVYSYVSAEHKYVTLDVAAAIAQNCPMSSGANAEAIQRAGLRAALEDGMRATEVAIYVRGLKQAYADRVAAASMEQLDLFGNDEMFDLSMRLQARYASRKVADIDLDLQSFKQILGRRGGNLTARQSLLDRYGISNDGDVQAIRDVMVKLELEKDGWKNYHLDEARAAEARAYADRELHLEPVIVELPTGEIGRLEDVERSLSIDDELARRRAGEEAVDAGLAGDLFDDDVDVQERSMGGAPEVEAYRPMGDDLFALALRTDGPEVLGWRLLQIEEELRRYDSGEDSDLSDADVSVMRDQLARGRAALEVREGWRKPESLDINEGHVDVSVAEGLFDRLAKGNQDLVYLGKRLFALAKRFGVSFNFADLPDYRVFGEAHGGDITFSRRLFESDLVSDGEKAAAMLHELVHALTSWGRDVDTRVAKDDAPEAWRKAWQELSDVYESLKGDLAKKGLYGAASVDEFVAELTNPVFRRELKQMGLWERTWNGIKRFVKMLLGGEVDAREVNALDVAMDRLDVLLTHIDEGMLAAEFAEGDATGLENHRLGYEGGVVYDSDYDVAVRSGDFSDGQKNNLLSDRTRAHKGHSHKDASPVLTGLRKNAALPGTTPANQKKGGHIVSNLIKNVQAKISNLKDILSSTKNGTLVAPAMNGGNVPVTNKNFVATIASNLGLKHGSPTSWYGSFKHDDNGPKAFVRMSDHPVNISRLSLDEDEQFVGVVVYNSLKKRNIQKRGSNIKEFLYKKSDLTDDRMRLIIEDLMTYLKSGEYPNRAKGRRVNNEAEIVNPSTDTDGDSISGPVALRREGPVVEGLERLAQEVEQEADPRLPEARVPFGYVNPSLDPANDVEGGVVGNPRTFLEVNVYPNGGRVPVEGSPADRASHLPWSLHHLIRMYRELSGGEVPRVVAAKNRGPGNDLGWYMPRTNQIYIRAQLFGLIDKSDIAFIHDSLKAQGFFRHEDVEWCKTQKKGDMEREKMLSDRELERQLNRLVDSRIKSGVHQGIGTKVMAHELWHWIDNNDGVRIKDKESILHHIFNLNGAMKEVVRGFSEHDKLVIIKEAKAFIPWWRTGAPGEMEAYFKRPEEMYAEMGSAFFLDPGAVRDRCPTYYNAMLQGLASGHPKAMESFAEINKSIYSGTDLDGLMERLQSTWTKGAEVDRRQLFDALTKGDDRNRKMDLVHAFIDRYQPIVMVVEDSQKRVRAKLKRDYESGLLDEAGFRAGMKRLDEEVMDMRYQRALYTHQYGRSKVFLSDVNGRVLERARSLGVSMSELNTYMHLMRVIELKDRATAHGIDAPAAQRLLDRLEAQWGQEKWQSVRVLAGEFRALYEQQVINNANVAEMLGSEAIAFMQEHKHYVTMRHVVDNEFVDEVNRKRENDGDDVLDVTLQQLRGLGAGSGTGGVGYTLRRLEGSFKATKSPILATVQTALSILEVAQRNHVLVELSKTLERNGYSDFKVLGVGERHINNDRYGTLEFMEGGKKKAILVPRPVADAINSEAVPIPYLTMASRVINAGFTTNSFAFVLPANMRDLASLSINNKGLRRSLVHYASALNMGSLLAPLAVVPGVRKVSSAVASVLNVGSWVPFAAQFIPPHVMRKISDNPIGRLLFNEGTVEYWSSYGQRCAKIIQNMSFEETLKEARVARSRGNEAKARELEYCATMARHALEDGVLLTMNQMRRDDYSRSDLARIFDKYNLKYEDDGDVVALPDRLRRMLRDAVKDPVGKAMGAARQAISAYWESAGFLAERQAMAVKLAGYCAFHAQSLKGHGYSETNARSIALRTIEDAGDPDFTRKGMVANQVEMFLSPYWNARKEGFARMVRAAKRNPGDWTAKALIEGVLPRMVSLLVSSGVAAGLVLKAFGDDDDPRSLEGTLAGDVYDYLAWQQRAYKNVSPYKQVNYRCLPIWMSNDGGTTLSLTVPVSEEMKAIEMAVVAAWNKAGLNTNMPAVGASEAVATFVRSFFPDLDGNGSAVALVRSLVAPFLMGENPWQTFRQANQFTDDEFATRWTRPYAMESSLKGAWNNSPLVNLKRWQLREHTGDVAEDAESLKELLELPVVGPVFARFGSLDGSGREAAAAQWSKIDAANEAAARLDARDAARRCARGEAVDGNLVLTDRFWRELNKVQETDWSTARMRANERVDRIFDRNPELWKRATESLNNDMRYTTDD